MSITKVENASRATRFLAQTTLRNVLGTRSLSEILSEREAISHNIQVLTSLVLFLFLFIHCTFPAFSSFLYLFFLFINLLFFLRLCSLFIPPPLRSPSFSSFVSLYPPPLPLHPGFLFIHPPSFSLSLLYPFPPPFLFISPSS